ncbi:response regulator transcription factor [Chloroflexota bacterium]
MKVLIIDDDPVIVENLELTFKVSWPNSEVISTNFGKPGITLTETERPDLIILDLGLPDISGFDVLKRIRQFSNIPIVVLTVSNEEMSIAKGFELNADEYIIKPFRQLEFLARIKAIIKRQNLMVKSVIYYGPFLIDFSSSIVKIGTKAIKLTSIESTIFYNLLANRGEFITNSGLAEKVWGESYPGCRETLRVHIRHLREKIEPEPNKPRYIITKPGIGYSSPIIK